MTFLNVIISYVRRIIYCTNIFIWRFLFPKSAILSGLYDLNYSLHQHLIYRVAKLFVAMCFIQLSLMCSVILTLILPCFGSIFKNVQ